MNHTPSSPSRRRNISMPAPTVRSIVIRKIRPTVNQVTGKVAYPQDQYRHATSGAVELKQQVLATPSPKPISVVSSCIQPSPGAEKADAETKKARKKRTKPKIHEYEPIPLNELKWLTIAQTALRYPSFSEKALRHLVAQAEAYGKYPKSGVVSNGFLPCIVRPAGQRKILIDAERLEAWLKSFAVSSN